MGSLRIKNKAAAAAQEVKPEANGGSAGKKRKSAKNGVSKKRPAPQKKAAKKQKQDDEQYDVEQVQGVMVKRGVTSYYIKWSGYPESKNSWEPSDNVSCDALLKKFLENSLANVKIDEEEEEEAEASETEERIEEDN